jgi:adenine-specific DNA-methyltransferase
MLLFMPRLLLPKMPTLCYPQNVNGPLLVSSAESPEAVCENEAYLKEQLITYIGNKRSLLGFIGNGVRRVQQRLNRNRLAMFDVFSGSGIVARYFKQFSRLIIANDLEGYSRIINECYLSNQSDVDMRRLRQRYDAIIGELANKPLERGLISRLYAPADENNIRPEERVFYTLRNAAYIDTARRLIGDLPKGEQQYFLAPLLSEASIHANTCGVFKGFYKNRDLGIGQYGGRNQDALGRITGNIKLPFPVFSSFDADVIICQGDANAVIEQVPEVDVAYVDPPYNQHPYGSNYFMLNVILDNKCPEHISAVSGIPEGWNRSRYNNAKSARLAMTELLSNIKAQFVLVSFNSEGFISPEEMQSLLNSFGVVETLETAYNAFRGSRNLNHRDSHGKEYLYLVEK